MITSSSTYGFWTEPLNCRLRIYGLRSCGRRVSRWGKDYNAPGSHIIKWLCHRASERGHWIMHPPGLSTCLSPGLQGWFHLHSLLHVDSVSWPVMLTCRWQGGFSQKINTCGILHLWSMMCWVKILNFTQWLNSEASVLNLKQLLIIWINEIL